jgi:hypothetical protein
MKRHTRVLLAASLDHNHSVSARVTEPYTTSTVSLLLARPIPAAEAPRKSSRARHTPHQVNPLQIDIAGTRTTSALSIARTAVVALTVCAGLATGAQAETVASIAPSLSPNRLHAKASLTFTMRFSGGAYGVPTPVSRSVVRFPAGLTLDIPHLSSCPAARLRTRGASGCPTRSQIGHGRALVETRAGTEIITEEATLWVFLGPPNNLQPTFEILAQGYTPIDERKVFTGVVLAAEPPYGEELQLTIPPIPTLVFEPDASIVTLTLTIGPSGHRRTPGATAVLTPSSCPAGGLPFAAETTYVDGSTGSALATTPCPA